MDRSKAEYKKNPETLVGKVKRTLGFVRKTPVRSFEDGNS